MLKTFMLMLIASASTAQTVAPAPAAVKPDAPFRLFLTGLGSNMAIKLDTRTGLVWQIKYDQTQAAAADASRWQKIVNSASLADGSIPGRFTIQWDLPAGVLGVGNQGVLLMLDQIDGRVWLLTLGKDSAYSFAPAPDAQ